MTSIRTDKPFRFLDLPQELQDKVCGFYYDERTVSVEYSGRDYSPRYRGRRVPPVLTISEDRNHSLLLTSKHVCETASAIIEKIPIHLSILYDNEKRMTALQVISSRGPTYDKLRDKTVSITVCGFNSKNTPANLTHSFELISHHFPLLKEVTFYYPAIRQVFDDYERVFETPE